MLKTFIHRANRICKPHLLQHELAHIEQDFQSNGYTLQDIKRALHPVKEKAISQSTTTGKVLLPCMKEVTDRIGKLFNCHSIKTISKPTQHLRYFLRSAKDPIDPLTSAGVYRIPCS